MPSRVLLAGVLLAPLLAGCGLGTAGVASTSGGGKGNAAPTISGFQVVGPKVSPAQVRFVLADQEGDPAPLELFYAPAGTAPALVSRFTGLPSNPATLTAAPAGTAYTVNWDFAQEPLLPADASFVEGVQVFAVVAGRTALIPGANAAEVGMGNDPPLVEAVEPPADEASAIAPFRVSLSDSSGDVVDVGVHFRPADDPGAPWLPARPAGLDPSAPTPDPAITGVEAPAGGTELVFFWDTEYDLPAFDDDVLVRFTPDDGTAVGSGVVTASLRVDNNLPPRATLREGALVLRNDRGGGIAVPYEVADPEGDIVQTVVQWRREGETFPELPDDVEGLAAALADPAERERLRIATELAVPVHGRILPAAPGSVRLPELVQGEGTRLLGSAVGGELEILRGSNLLAPLGLPALGLDVVNPVHAVPLGDGRSVLLLDRPHGGNWRLREVELVSGAVARTLVSSAPGEPRALDLERDESAVLVASDLGQAWRLDRVDLASGVRRTLAIHDGTTEGGPIRDVASLGPARAAITVGSSLVLVDAGDSLMPAHVAPSPRAVRSVRTEPPRLVTLWRGLDQPWGLARHPWEPGHLALAERGADRVSLFDLVTRRVQPIVAPPGALEQPTDVAFADGHRLLVVTREALHEVREVRLGDPGVPVVEHASLISGEPRLATGPDDLVLVTIRFLADLTAAGGMAQVRRIEAFDPRTATATLDPGAPDPEPNAPWRLCRQQKARRAVPEGSSVVFLWDSRDSPGAGQVFVRAVPFDADRGLESASTTAVRLRDPLDGTEETAIDSSPYDLLELADLDLDGDLDAVAIGRDGGGAAGLRLHLQTAPGVFEARPDLLPFLFESTSNDVAVLDIDGDGDLDLAAAGSSRLYLFLRDGEAFERTVLPVGLALVTSIVDVDLTGDGRSDAVFASSNGRVESLRHGAGFERRLLAELPGSGIWTLEPMDLQPDGRIDLLAGNSGGGVFALLQGSDGSFQAHALASEDVLDLVVEDFDGDLRVDVATAGPVGVLMRRPAWGPGGAGAEEALLSLPSSTLKAFENRTAGGSIAAVSTETPRTLNLLHSVESGPFARRSALEAKLSPNSSLVGYRDHDGDGHRSFLFSSGAEIRAADGFSVSATPTSIRGVTAQALADLGGDAFPDLVVRVSGEVHTFEGLGGGAYRDEGKVGTGDLPVQVVADLDGDGSPDVAGSQGTHSIRVTLAYREADDSWHEEVLELPRVHLSSSAMSTGDVDNDGDLDLTVPLLSAIVDGEVVILRQELPRSYSIGSLPAAEHGAASVRFADVDADGDLDLGVQIIDLAGAGSGVQILVRKAISSRDASCRGLEAAILSWRTSTGTGTSTLASVARAFGCTTGMAEATSPFSVFRSWDRR